MTARILFRHDVATFLVGAARAVPRTETGGILVGHREDGILVVTHALIVPAPIPAGDRYVRLDEPAGLLLRDFLDQREESDPAGYVGEWHSHPGASGPSAIDRRVIHDLTLAVGDGLALIVVRPNHNPRLVGRVGTIHRGGVRVFKAEIVVFEPHRNLHQTGRGTKERTEQP